MKTLIKKEQLIYFLSIILLIGLSYYVIGANWGAVGYFVLGFFLAFINFIQIKFTWIFKFLNKNSIFESRSWSTFLIIITSIAISVLVQSNIESGVLTLAGLNMGGLFFQLKYISKRTIDLSFINIAALSTILLSSGIEKFRGYNKLDSEDIYFTIPILLLILFLTFLFSGLIQIIIKRKKISEKYALLFIIFITALSIIPIQLFFKETGSDLILIPFLCGMIARATRTYVRPKTIFNEFIEIALLIILPYQISGFMGIGFSFFGYMGLSYIAGANLYSNITSLVIQTSKFAPLLFLFAIQEIRENKGFINKLDITNGYVSGWILISIIFVKWAGRYYKNIRKILENNEVMQFWPHLITFFALTTFTLVYRLGKFESAIAIVFGSVIYLFIISGLEKNIKKEKARFILSLASFFGSLALLVLLA